MGDTKTSAEQMLLASMLSIGKYSKEVEDMINQLGSDEIELAFLHAVRDTMAEIVRKMDARLVELEQGEI